MHTPDLLHFWGYKKSGCCCLCRAEKYTLHHILSHSSFSLNVKIFTWKHDSVLALILCTLMEHIEAHNKSQNTCNKTDPIQLVKAGFNKTHSHSLRTSDKNNLLSTGNDWRILADFPNLYFVFPPEIYSCSKLPDILIWSSKLKKLSFWSWPALQKKAFKLHS